MKLPQNSNIMAWSINIITGINFLIWKIAYLELSRKSCKHQGLAALFLFSILSSTSLWYSVVCWCEMCGIITLIMWISQTVTIQVYARLSREYLVVISWNSWDFQEIKDMTYGEPCCQELIIDVKSMNCQPHYLRNLVMVLRLRFS